MKHIKLVFAVMLIGVMLTGCGGNPSKKGVEYLESGEYKKAIEQFEKAIDKDVNTGDAYRGIGIAKWEQKDYEGASEAFQNALEHDAEKTGTIYNFLGSCELKLDHPEEALNYYRLALAREDNSEKMTKEMRFNMIVAYEKMGDLESAKVLLKEYLEDYPDDEDAKKEIEFLETR